MKRTGMWVGIASVLLLAFMFEAVRLIWVESAFANSTAVPVNVNTSVNQDSVTGDPMEKAGVHEWDPFSEMQSIWEEMAAMQRRMESVLASHQMFPGPGVEGLSFSPRGGFFDPDVEIQETKGAYTVKVDLPGMEKDKIDVQVTDNVLRISGERDRTEESRNEDEGNYFYRSERTFGSFSRQIPLPENVDTLKAKAEYKNGVLLVTLPKLQPSGQEKQATKVPVI